MDDQRRDRQSSGKGRPARRHRDETGSTPAAKASPSAPMCFEIDDEIVTVFVTETLDHLGSIEASALKLEESGDDLEALEEVFRLFHTIKGNAGALGFTHIQQLAHRLEDLLHRTRAGERQIAEPEVELVLSAIDLLTSMVRAVPGRPPGGTSGDFADEREALERAVGRILGDEQVRGAGRDAERPARNIERTSPEKAARPREKPSRNAGPPSPGAGPPPMIKVATHKLDTLVDLVGELVIAQSIVQQHSGASIVADERLQRALGQFHRLTHEVHQGAMAMRLVPIRPTFQRMQRLVRDLSQKSGKPADLTLIGEDIELDRKVVDEIGDPLMHMLRNSMDHGIEDPEARVRAGKPARGHLSLAASHQSGNVVIAVSDDGRGIDVESLYRHALRRGIVEPGARPSDSELQALIFSSGLSTAENVTEMSGRGVGMDVVRRNVESLRGRIEIRSQPGLGTTFLIKLPLTLATIEGLLLAVAGQRYVLPTFSVQESLNASPERLRAVPGGGRVIEVRNRLLPVVRLADLFGVAGAATGSMNGVLVVIDDDGRRVALMVDQLLGKQNLVIKSLGGTFDNPEGIAGGAILGDGRVGLILDAGGLMRLCERGRSVHAA